MAIFYQKLSEVMKLHSYPQLFLSYYLSNFPLLPTNALLKLSSGLGADYDVLLKEQIRLAKRVTRGLS